MKRPGDCATRIGAGICLGVGLLCSVAIGLRLHRDEEARIRRGFAHEINECATSIDEQVRRDIAVVHALNALFDSSEVVTRAEFRLYAQFLLSRYPSIRSLAWAPRVRAEERQALETQVREQGVDQFEISERKADWTFARAGDRDEYYPLLFVEVREAYRSPVGFDEGSSAARREAMAAARDSGEARASGRIELLQNTDDESGVLVFAPDYEGACATVSERRLSLRGFTIGAFRIMDVLTAKGVQMPEGGVELLLLDESVERNGRLLYSRPAPDGGDLVPAYRYRRGLKPVADRQWSLVATPTGTYVSERRTATPYAGVCIGMLLTGWLSYYLARLARDKKHVEEQVARRTEELRTQSAALVASNAELCREGARRRVLQKRFADVTDEEQRRLGQELHDSLGQKIAAACMLSRALQQRLAARGLPEAEQLGLLAQNAQEAQAQVRALSKGLLPVEVDPEGLRAALSELATSARGFVADDVECVCDEAVMVDDSAAATHLYRIAQEALRNALDHGEASRVTIGLNLCDGELVLSIRDDGKGLKMGGTGPSGSGLGIMRHRAEIIGATFEIDSREGQGTTIMCRLPLAQGGSS